MGIKSITLSIKRAGKVHTWEGSRALASHLVDPQLFRTLEDSKARHPLVSRARRISDEFLEDLEKSPLVPGTCGWIGLDVDRRVVWDAQSYTEFGCYLETIDDPDVPNPTLVPTPPLLRSMAEGPWRCRAMSVSGEMPWLERGALSESSQWDLVAPQVIPRLVGQFRKIHPDAPKLHRAWVEIEPSIPKGWRVVAGLHPVDEPAYDLVRFGQLMRLFRSGGWGWDESLWPAWKEHAIEYRQLPPSEVNALAARHLSSRLDRVLPSSHPSPARPGPRF